MRLRAHVELSSLFEKNFIFNIGEIVCMGKELRHEDFWLGCGLLQKKQQTIDFNDIKTRCV